MPSVSVRSLSSKGQTGCTARSWLIKANNKSIQGASLKCELLPLLSSYLPVHSFRGVAAAAAAVVIMFPSNIDDVGNSSVKHFAIMASTTRNLCDCV